jgi:hypothetical protein
MKLVTIPRLAFWLCLILLLGLRSLRAAESSTESSSYDAVAAAPDNHRVIFENEKVRVLEVIIKPGEKEPFHEHPRFSVMNIIRGAPLRITQATLEDGKIVTGKTIDVGKDNFQPPPLWMPPQGLHSAECRNGGIFRLSHRTERGRKAQRYKTVGIAITDEPQPKKRKTEWTTGAYFGRPSGSKSRKPRSLVRLL